jgi:hypothetical protein
MRKQEVTGTLDSRCTVRPRSTGTWLAMWLMSISVDTIFQDKRLAGECHNMTHHLRSSLFRIC